MMTYKEWLADTIDIDEEDVNKLEHYDKDSLEQYRLYAQADEGTFDDLTTCTDAELDTLLEVLDIDAHKLLSDYHFNNMIEDDAERCRTAFD